MRPVVLLVPTLFTIILMSDMYVAMAGDHIMRRATGQKSRLERAGQPMKSARVESVKIRTTFGASLPCDAAGSK